MRPGWLLAPIAVAAALLVLAQGLDETALPGSGASVAAGPFPLEIPQPAPAAKPARRRPTPPRPVVPAVARPAWVKRWITRPRPLKAPEPVVIRVNVLRARDPGLPLDPDIAPYDDADTPDRDFSLPAQPPGERAR